MSAQQQQTLDVYQAPDLDEQIREVERELEVRRSVYPKWIERGKIKLQTANYRVECLKAVLETLKARKEPHDG